MSLRARMILFAFVTLLLVLGLTAGTFLSLTSASREAEEAREELAKLDLLDRLETSCSGYAIDPVACRRSRRAAEALARKGWREEERAELSRILSLLAEAREGEPPPRPAELREAVSALRRSILSRAGEDLRMAEEPTHRRALRLLAAALLLAVGGSATFAWLYVRIVRERRILEERLARSEKLSALATLAAGVSHELNNPLATIAMSSEALSSRLPRGSEEWTYATAVGEEADRCRTIIADLSDLARGGSLDREPVDPAELAAEAVRTVSRRVLPAGVEIRTVVSEGLPLVSADRGKLLQLLMNLLQNAVEAVRAGGRVTLSVDRSGRQLRFSVEDDGKGIPRHLLDRIFEPFFTDKPKGAGLGLTISHRIAELHGGQLSARSEGPGHGATFTLTLPLEAPHGQ